MGSLRYARVHPMNEPALALPETPTADNDGFVYNLGAALASLQAAGGGSFNVTCSSLSGLSVLGGGGNLSATQATQAGCGTNIVDQPIRVGALERVQPR